MLISLVYMLMKSVSLCLILVVFTQSTMHSAAFTQPSPTRQRGMPTTMLSEIDSSLLCTTISDSPSNSNSNSTMIPEPLVPTNIIPTHRACVVCNELQERFLFPRKEYMILDRPPTCTHCRKTVQAERVKVPPPRPILRGRKADSGVTRKPNNFGYCNYVDKLFGLDCFKEIVACGAFTTAKDVSESMAALQAASHHGNIQDAKNVLCLSIGDGSTPRSAVLVAFLKGWRSISIDPALKPEWKGSHETVRGLLGFSGTLEEFMETSTTEHTHDHVVLLCVHSHARFVQSATVSKIRARYGNTPMTIVSLPCCAKFRHVADIGRPPDIKYDDDCVFSACRTVEVWNFPK